MLPIDGVLLNFKRLDNLATGNTAIHRLDDAWAKILVTLVFIITAISFGKYDLSAMVPFSIIPVAMIALGDLPSRYIIRKIALLCPFALVSRTTLILLLLPLTVFAADVAHGTSGEQKLVQVSAGCFEMGDGFGEGYFNEKPLHEVCVSEFSIGRFHVTKKEFSEFVKEADYRTDAEQGDGCYVYDGSSWKKERTANWRSPGFVQTQDHPVVCVSWNDSVAYAHWLSQKTGTMFRLATEAEWEYAARSGGKRQRFAGGNDADPVAWYAGNAGDGTHPAGKKQPNGLGLYDMSGNAWQWTADWYGEKYYRQSPRENPQGPAFGSSRVFRGGSWFYDMRGARASFRDFFLPDYRSSHLGFRLVSPELKQEVK